MSCIAVLTVCVLSLTPYLTSSTELVRMRNALVLQAEDGLGFEWTPDSVPPSFLLERGPPDPFFLDGARRLGLADMTSDWERALAISRNLLSHPSVRGPAIQSDLKTTYEGIVNSGGGYCGDFARVFMAFALAAGIPVRAWAFSFDGFGGYGHIWPEIWNRQLGRWQLVGIYNNFYFHRGDGVAISALDFRKAMQEKPRTVRHALLSLTAPPGYPIESKMWDYYSRGLPEWYMIWGNNVFSYDAVVMRQGLSHFGRGAEQLVTIVEGVYPGVVPLVTVENRSRVDALWRLRWHLWIAGVIGALAFLGSVISATCYLRLRMQGKSQS